MTPAITASNSFKFTQVYLEKKGRNTPDDPALMAFDEGCSKTQISDATTFSVASMIGALNRDSKRMRWKRKKISDRIYARTSKRDNTLQKQISRNRSHQLLQSQIHSSLGMYDLVSLRKSTFYKNLLQFYL